MNDETEITINMVNATSNTLNLSFTTNTAGEISKKDRIKAILKKSVEYQLAVAAYFDNYIRNGEPDNYAYDFSRDKLHITHEDKLTDFIILFDIDDPLRRPDLPLVRDYLEQIQKIDDAIAPGNEYEDGGNNKKVKKSKRKNKSIKNILNEVMNKKGKLSR